MSPDYRKPPRIGHCLCCGTQFGALEMRCRCFTVGHCSLCQKCPAHCQCPGGPTPYDVKHLDALAQQLLDADRR